MEKYFVILIILPLVAFVVSLFIPKKNEKLISSVAFTSILANNVFLLVFIAYAIYRHKYVINIYEGTIYESSHYIFFLDFYFDRITFLYLSIGSLLTFLVATYSRYYLHREKGYKRFFNTILFFYVGYSIVVTSGNFETLFVGWEIIGISSFLLIAFYRERYLPVTNAFKVFSIYRIGDIGIILAMWASHHLWHENITFQKLSNYTLFSEHLAKHSSIGIFISLALVVAALVKSAQLPFSSWLPRAMEGPTPSSAIFYGSLSVHLGAFLLLRTFPFWEHQTVVRVFIIFVGISTSLVATMVARVQSSIKAQVAYSSVAQIGVIFIEIAIGWHLLALMHIAGNAFLRTYQLLVSPSVVSYMIKEQFYNFKKREHIFEDSFPKKFENSLFILSLNEFKLESFMSSVFWKPLKRISKLSNKIYFKVYIFLYTIFFIVSLILLFNKQHLEIYGIDILPIFFSMLGMFATINAFAENNNPILAWILIVINHLWVAIAILFNEKVDVNEILVYLSGILISFVLGSIILYKLKKSETEFHLNKYLGHIYEHKKYAFLFLVAAVGISGFPITSTFIGIDLIFSHIHAQQPLLAFFVSISFILGGIAAIRVYSRLFLGIHCKAYHELPNQNS